MAWNISENTAAEKGQAILCAYVPKRLRSGAAALASYFSATTRVNLASRNFCAPVTTSSSTKATQPSATLSTTRTPSSNGIGADDMAENRLGLEISTQSQSSPNTIPPLVEHSLRTWLMAAQVERPSNVDRTQARALRVDAIRYMCMTLQDPTPQETLLIRNALPDAVLLTPPLTRNSLRQSAALLTCWCMAVTFFLIPVMVSFINKALVFERKHHVIERVASTGLDLGNMLFEKLQSSPVVLAIVTSGMWMIESVIRGVVDGMQQAKVNREYTLQVQRA